MPAAPFDALEVLESISDAFFALDKEWRFTFVNGHAEQVWGRDRDSLLGRVMWDEFPGLAGSIFGPVYRRAAVERVPVEFSGYHADRRRWYQIRVFPANDGMAVYLHDSTESRNADENIARLSAEAERERRVYHTVLSNTADFNYVFDLDGRFTFANDALLHLWQKSLADVVGKSFFQLDYPHDLAERLQQEIQQTIASRQPVRGETAYTSVFGTRAYEYIFVPVVDADGRVEAVAGSTRDITAYKDAERELRSEARRKDEFLATLAHELRNPLAPIRNALEVSRMSKDNEAVIEQAHDIMERQLGNMVRLIDDLLDLSRISLAKVELRRQAVDLASIVQSAVETARPHIEQAGHTLRLTMPAEPLCIDADATRLAQAFSNLLTNAAKFTPRDGHIQLTVEATGTSAVVAVKDNGIGIEEGMLQQVFTMFTQVVGTLERAQGGLGIGLTLAKGLVELHGGTIEARSDGPGLGSEFIVRLPLMRQEIECECAPDDVATATSFMQRHILIVDDNADSTASLALMLKMMGHDTMTASDGLEALRIAESFLPDVCLLDIGMPHLNGYELARRLRQQPWSAGVLLVALTGWGQEDDKRRSADAGIDVHLVKPVDPAALVTLLESHSIQTMPLPAISVAG